MTTLNIPDLPKQIRETLCIAQAAIGHRPFDEHRKRRDIDLIGRLIDECDRHRPLGPDGKHGDRHTPTCGCENQPDPPRWRRAWEQARDALFPPKPQATQEWEARK